MNEASVKNRDDKFTKHLSTDNEAQLSLADNEVEFTTNMLGHSSRPYDCYRYFTETTHFQSKEHDDTGR